MKKKIPILITDQFEKSLIDKFGKEFVVSFRPKITIDELASNVHKYKILLISTRLPITKNILDKAKQLELIIRLGAGVDHIDLQECKKRKIIVCNTPLANISGVVEYVFGQLLRVYRRFGVLNEQVLKGSFREGLAKGSELAGKALGIIGVGRIGQTVAETAKIFGMRTLGHDPYIGKKLKKKAKIDEWFTDLYEMISNADVVSLHIPLTKETKYMVDDKFLGTLKEDAVFINTSRGKVVHLDSLIEYSKNRNNKFILDVFEYEPFMPSDEIFTNTDIFFLSPHAGAFTRESLYKRSNEAIEQIKEFTIGKKPHGKINLKRGY